jgi:exonuclease III
MLSDLNLYALHEILETQSYDVIFLNETRFAHLPKLANKNYQLYASVEQQGRAQGSAIIVKSSFKVFKIEIAEAQDLNVTVIKLICAKGQHLILASVYIPPVGTNISGSRERTISHLTTTL